MKVIKQHRELIYISVWPVMSSCQDDFGKAVEERWFCCYLVPTCTVHDWLCRDSLDVIFFHAFLFLCLFTPVSLHILSCLFCSKTSTWRMRRNLGRSTKGSTKLWKWLASWPPPRNGMYGFHNEQHRWNAAGWSETDQCVYTRLYFFWKSQEKSCGMIVKSACITCVI